MFKLSDETLLNILLNIDNIKNSNEKQLKKNTLLLKSLDLIYPSLLINFKSNFEKHLEVIEKTFNINFSKAKYQHYLKNNHQDVYSIHILNKLPREKIKRVEDLKTLELINSNIALKNDLIADKSLDMDLSDIVLNKAIKEVDLEKNELLKEYKALSTKNKKIKINNMLILLIVGIISTSLSIYLLDYLSLM